MTKKDALTLALNTVTDETAKAIYQKMIDQLSKERTPLTDEQKAARNSKRREANAQARSALFETIAPVLRKVMKDQELTATEIHNAAAASLPVDFTIPRVRAMLTRDMANEVEVIPHGNKPNTYRLK